MNSKFYNFYKKKIKENEIKKIYEPWKKNEENLYNNYIKKNTNKPIIKNKIKLRNKSKYHYFKKNYSFSKKYNNLSNKYENYSLNNNKNYKKRIFIINNGEIILPNIYKYKDNKFKFIKKIKLRKNKNNNLNKSINKLKYLIDLQKNSII